MEYTPIRKSLDQFVVETESDRLREVRATFSWDDIRRETDGLPGGKGLNIAHEAIDRHAIGPRHLSPGDALAKRTTKSGTLPTGT